MTPETTKPFPTTFRLINWNIERHKPDSWQSQSLLAEITSLNPDICCFTEAWRSSVISLGGHFVSAKGTAWSRQYEDERKVVLWSKQPWSRVSEPASLAAKGAAVVADTEFCGRVVRVLGVCIPYHMATPYGAVRKRPPWSQHTEFLEGLVPTLQDLNDGAPMIVLGDFNRKIPRSTGPMRPFELLESALAEFSIVTTGVIPGVNAPTIDHVVLGAGLLANAAKGLSRHTTDGRARSDHFGILLDAEFAR